VPLWLVIILLVGGTHRVTRLLARDQLPLTAWPREHLVRYWFPAFAEEETRNRYRQRHDREATPHWGFLGHSLAYLVTCDWCVSMYVAAGLTYLTWRWTDVMFWILAGLTSSTVTGLVSQREPD